jgi:hypothetical protein
MTGKPIPEWKAATMVDLTIDPARTRNRREMLDRQGRIGAIVLEH